MFRAMEASTETRVIGAGGAIIDHDMRQCDAELAPVLRTRIGFGGDARRRTDAQ